MSSTNQGGGGRQNRQVRFKPGTTNTSTTNNNNTASEDESGDRNNRTVSTGRPPRGASANTGTGTTNTPTGLSALSTGGRGGSTATSGSSNSNEGTNLRNEKENDNYDDDSEDNCYFCGRSGVLLICDVPGCNKVYHSYCLGYEPAETERFHCPHHFCGICGEPDRQILATSDTSLIKCTTCPTAYCPKCKSDHETYLGSLATVMNSSSAATALSITSSSNNNNNNAAWVGSPNGSSTDNVDLGLLLPIDGSGAFRTIMSNTVSPRTHNNPDTTTVSSNNRKGSGGNHPPSSKETNETVGGRIENTLLSTTGGGKGNTVTDRTNESMINIGNNASDIMNLTGGSLDNTDISLTEKDKIVIESELSASSSTSSTNVPGSAGIGTRKRSRNTQATPSASTNTEGISGTNDKSEGVTTNVIPTRRSNRLTASTEPSDAEESVDSTSVPNTNDTIPTSTSKKRRRDTVLNTEKVTEGILAVINEEPNSSTVITSETLPTTSSTLHSTGIPSTDITNDLVSPGTTKGIAMGNKRRESTLSSSSAPFTTRGNAKTSAISRWQCFICCTDDKRVQFARQLEWVWATIIHKADNTSLKENTSGSTAYMGDMVFSIQVKALLGPVTDNTYARLYAAHGHSRRRMGLPTLRNPLSPKPVAIMARLTDEQDHSLNDTPMVDNEEMMNGGGTKINDSSVGSSIGSLPPGLTPTGTNGTSQSSPNGPSSGGKLSVANKRQLLRRLGELEPRTLASLLSRGLEMDAVPWPPTCLGDLLANIRACRYITVDDVRRDLDNIMAVAGEITGIKTGATLLSSSSSVASTGSSMDEDLVHSGGIENSIVFAPTPAPSFAYDEKGEMDDGALMTGIVKLPLPVLDAAESDTLQDAKEVSVSVGLPRPAPVASLTALTMKEQDTTGGAYNGIQYSTGAYYEAAKGVITSLKTALMNRFTRSTSPQRSLHDTLIAYRAALVGENNRDTIHPPPPPTSFSFIPIPNDDIMTSIITDAETEQSTGGTNVIGGWVARLLSVMGLTEAEARDRVYAARRFSSRPESTWSRRPYVYARSSLEEWCHELANAPVARRNNGRRAEESARKAVENRRKPTLVHIGGRDPNKFKENELIVDTGVTGNEALILSLGDSGRASPAVGDDIPPVISFEDVGTSKSGIVPGRFKAIFTKIFDEQSSELLNYNDADISRGTVTFEDAPRELLGTYDFLSAQYAAYTLPHAIRQERKRQDRQRLSGYSLSSSPSHIDRLDSLDEDMDGYRENPSSPTVSPNRLKNGTEEKRPHLTETELNLFETYSRWGKEYLGIVGGPPVQGKFGPGSVGMHSPSTHANWLANSLSSSSGHNVHLLSSPGNYGGSLGQLRSGSYGGYPSTMFSPLPPSTDFHHEPFDVQSLLNMNDPDGLVVLKALGLAPSSSTTMETVGTEPPEMIDSTTTLNTSTNDEPDEEMTPESMNGDQLTLSEVPTTKPTETTATVTELSSSSSSSSSATDTLHNKQMAFLVQTVVSQQRRLATTENALGNVIGLLDRMTNQFNYVSARMEEDRQDRVKEKETTVSQIGQLIQEIGVKRTAGRVPQYDLNVLDNDENEADSDRRLRSILAKMTSRDRQGALTLAEMAPLDVDQTLDNLADFLPPSSEEVLGLFDALSAHLRRAVITHGELRSAWVASRRGMLMIPAQVDVERRFRLRDGTSGDIPVFPEEEEQEENTDTGLVTGAAVGRPYRTTYTDADVNAMSGGVITLGDGKVALEYAAANASLRAHIRELESQLAALKVTMNRQGHGLTSENITSDFYVTGSSLSSGVGMVENTD